MGAFLRKAVSAPSQGQRAAQLTTNRPKIGERSSLCCVSLRFVVVFNAALL